MNYTIQLVDLPTTISGCTIENLDGTGTIILNSRLTQKSIKKACLGELSRARQANFSAKDASFIKAAT